MVQTPGPHMGNAHIEKNHAKLSTSRHAKNLSKLRPDKIKANTQLDQTAKQL